MMVATFLQHPGVTIRIRELGEAGIVSARDVETGGKTSVPGSDWRLVPELANRHATFEQKIPRSLQIRDDEIDFTKRASWSVGESVADLE
jgi:hypothetical protein